MKKSSLIALAMTVTIVLWMASGIFSSDGSEQSSVKAQTSTATPRMLVQTQQQSAKPVKVTLAVQGHVEPNKITTIRSDLAGSIDKILVDDGQWVAEGTILMHLALEDRQISLAKEKANLRSKEQSYERVKKLAKQKLQSQSMLEEAFANLKAAQASVAQLEFEINKLAIKAPFAGILNKRKVEQGDYLAKNTEVASFIDHSKLKVIVPISQQNIQQVHVGENATINFATGEVKTGKISHVSILANENTRTFRAEILVDNGDKKIPAGISAEAIIPIKTIEGHFISPAVLGLDNQGNIGVKTVDKNNQVNFHKATIVQSSMEGIWVVGLPHDANIITIGQGFVEPGVKVDTQQEKQSELL